MKRGRLTIAVVLILAVVASAAARQWAQHDRNMAIYGARGPVFLAGSSVGRMNSFAMGLLLGGLRGPLVMFLWMNSETKKNQRDLEGVQTQIEWIRMLQPEFDTVHLFQIWNTAYNLSVQRASLSNKYTTILGALDYAHSVDAQRPDDINIVAAIAQVYFDKLGNSAEKYYYRARVRRETLPHENAEKLRQGDPGWHRLSLDPMLDDKGNILPQYLEPTRQRPKTEDKDALGHTEWNDGSMLQYLKQYEPFPYGLSPMSLAYNCYKRAQVMQDYGQRHIQLSDLVVDSRPALALKGWCEEDWERGRRFELEAFGKAIPSERTDMETADASLLLNAKDENPAALQGALWSYRRAIRLAQDAPKEYWRHVEKYKTNLFTYMAHIDQLQMIEQLVTGDLNYLEAMSARQPDARQTFLKTAAEAYQKAIYKNQQILLKHYVDGDLLARAMPKGHDTSDLNDDKPNHIPFTEYAGMLRTITQLEKQSGRPNMHQDDQQEYLNYIQRAQTRLNLVHKAMQS